MQTISLEKTKQKLLALLIRTKPKPKDIDTMLGQYIKVEGIVEVTNGNNHFVAHNKATGNMLMTLASFVAMNGISYGSNNTIKMMSYNWTSNDGSTYMVIGSDATHPTLYNMSNLTAPIGTPPGTKPNSQSFATANPSNGVYRVVYTATWNGGTVAGTVGEIGLYLNAVPSLQTAGWSFQTNNTVYGNGSTVMTNRLSAADSDFTAFTIDTTVPLVIAWTIQFSFA